ncbi:MAG TPA: cell division protein ZapA [Candidatus Babeliales bacterium]|nr:cell division protein ZapA [Candidatus Babeliales bacterium]
MIDKKTRNCKVTIFGESYSLITSESTEHIIQAAQLVDSVMKEIASKASNADNTKCAVLAALRLASKSLLLEAEANHGKRKEEQLIEAIDRELGIKSPTSK